MDESAATPSRPADVQSLLADWLIDLNQGVATETEGTTEEELRWRPHPDANNIAVTIWHFSRWLDLVGRLWHGEDRESELWYAEGWADRTGYDPRGLGLLGLGVLTGYTPDEARSVPFLPREELLAYLGATVERLTGDLHRMTEHELHEPVSGPADGSTRTRYGLLRPVVQGSFGHLGEIEALRTLFEKQ